MCREYHWMLVCVSVILVNCWSEAAVIVDKIEQGRLSCDYKSQSRTSGQDDDYEEYEKTAIICSHESPFCFAYWEESNLTGEVIFREQGCWGASPRTACEQESCITTIYKEISKPSHRFCCCSTDNCNNNVSLVELDLPPATIWEDEGSLEEKSSSRSRGMLTGVFIGLSIAITLLILLATLISYFKRKKDSGKEKSENVEAGEKLMESPTDPDENWEVPDQVVLGKQLARGGRFGTVYSGIAGGCKVALKVFTTEQKEFYVNERFIYQALKETTGKNILRYHGWKEFVTLNSTNLILVLDKIVPGSLREFLQSTDLSLSQAIKLMKGIANGLSFLHGENKNGLVVAHRDLTSKNVLVDGNYTAYISDFGLSVQTSSSKYYFAGKERQAEFNSLAEAGTKRYMAPELLEGAVNLKDCENALKQVDIYAAALILWEIGHVCTDIRLGEEINYALPYELEIGKDITTETLIRFVVTRRDRPSFTLWKDTAVSRGIRDTLNESWDPEPDARLTALCIVERLNDISQLTFNKSDSNSTTPLETVTSSPWTGRNSCLERNLLDRSEDKSTEYLLTSEKHRNPFYGNNSTEGESMVTLNTDLSNGSGLTTTVVGPTPIPFLQNIRRV